jgi:hypothetical protein
LAGAAARLAALSLGLEPIRPALHPGHRRPPDMYVDDLRCSPRHATTADKESVSGIGSGKTTTAPPTGHHLAVVTGLADTGRV